MRNSITLLTVMLLFCGCVHDQDDRGGESSTTTAPPSTTIPPSTMHASATSSSTTSTLPNMPFSPPCSPDEENPYACRAAGGDAYCGDGWCRCACPREMNETPKIDVECDRYCKAVGYLSGSCEANMFECQVRRMVKTHYVDVLCIDARKNVCCCGTNKTTEKYSQLLNNAGKGEAGLTFEEK